MRAATACLLALVMLVVVGGTAGATAKQRAASPCERLAKRYKDRSPDRKLVLVARGDGETGNISGCVLPRGKIRTLAAWDDGLERDSARIVATAGTSVLVEDAHSDQYGGVSRSLTRVEVRGGRRLPLTAYGCLLDYRQTHCPDGTSYGKVALARTGAGALELVDFAAGTTTLRAFSPAGAVTTLADGPVQALRVTSTQIVWTQAGVEHAAPPPGLSLSPWSASGSGRSPGRPSPRRRRTAA